MIEYKRAIELILDCSSLFSERLNDKEVSPYKSNSPITGKNIVADRGYPPFHRVAMDGIAIKAKSFDRGVINFSIEGLQKAGTPQNKCTNENLCWEVMTGSILPENTDAVIPYEQIDITNNAALVKVDKVKYLQNVHRKDSDYKFGEVLIEKNAKVHSAHVGILASVGKAKIIAKKSPKIAIISTGDELVDIEECPETHQIRRSNVYAVESLLHCFGFCSTELFHIKDDPVFIREQLTSILVHFDCVILSGGVSMGKFDFVPNILKELAVQEVFYKVAQRPGKPLWFGISQKHQLVFGLPGNPISALVCARCHVIPGLEKAINYKRSFLWKAMLTQKIEFSKNLTFFYPVKIHIDDEARLNATPIAFNGSGDFASLGKSDGVVELCQGKDVFLPGEIYPIYLWTSENL